MNEERLNEIAQVIKDADLNDELFEENFIKNKRNISNSGVLAYLNWFFESYSSFDQWCSMGEAYLKSAEENLRKMILHPGKDFSDELLIFPILFCSVHGIECYLKGVYDIQLVILADLNGNQPSKPSAKMGHDIRKLCTAAIENTNELIKDDYLVPWTDFLQKLEFIDKYIEHVYSNTDNMADFRYPFSTKMESVFYTNESDVKKALENLTIDILEYFAWIVKLQDSFEEIYYFINGYITE